VIDVAVRMLDNVLDVTHWPLPEQQPKPHAKRRVGLGFTGLGDALIMLKLRYDTDEARAMATSISEFMRDRAYLASGRTGEGARRLPAVQCRHVPVRRQLRLAPAGRGEGQIRKHGLRNSHLLSIAPTGTISLAFADNASNGIEPPFSWTYTRKKRMADGTFKEYAVEDYAWRLYKHLGGDTKLPEYFVTALEISAQAHKDMVAAVAPYVDTSISKTVNVPADYPYADFEDLYLDAWKSGLKGLATYRPNSVLGSVLSVDAEREAEPSRSSRRTSTIDRRQPAPVDQERCPPRCCPPALARPARPARRQPAWTYMLNTPQGEFALFVGHIENEDGPRLPVRGVGQRRRPAARPGRRGQDPVDGHARQRPRWLKLKLDVLAKTVRRPVLRDADPAQRRAKLVPGVVSAFAQVVRYRCESSAPSTRRRPTCRRSSTRCSAARNPRPAPTARCRGRWTSRTRPPARTSCSA
jgi:ribonucleoside-diphosphate reductase alpha chain